MSDGLIFFSFFAIIVHCLVILENNIKENQKNFLVFTK